MTAQLSCSKLTKTKIKFVDRLLNLLNLFQMSLSWLQSASKKFLGTVAVVRSIVRYGMQFESGRPGKHSCCCSPTPVFSELQKQKLPTFAKKFISKL